MNLVNPSVNKNELHERLRWYVNVRWAFLLFLSVPGITTQYLDLGLSSQVVNNLLVALSALALNGFFYLILKKHNLGKRTLALLGAILITFDLLLATVLVYIQGGIESRTVIVYAVPILMSATLFGRKATYASATASALLYTGLITLDYSAVIEVPNINVPALHSDTLFYVRSVFFYAATLMTLGLIADFTTQLLKKRETIERMNELKGDFVALASHQLKTPLAEIREFTQNMIKGLTGELTDEQKEYVDHINKISGDTLVMVNELLDISKLEASKGRLVTEDVSLNEIVEKALETYNGRLRKPSSQIEIAKRENHTVIADRERLIEIICILLANAVKYTERSEIKIVTYAQGKFGVIEVIDHGPGIDADTMERIFKREAILEGKPSAKTGSGIGLYLAKQLIIAQDGDIVVESKPGEGSSFKLLLPLK